MHTPVFEQAQAIRYRSRPKLRPKRIDIGVQSPIILSFIKA